METIALVLREKVTEVVTQFYAVLSGLPKSKRILDMLSDEELRHLKSQQAQNLLNLAAARLDAREHEKMAVRVGQIHAIVGVDREELAHSRSILSETLYDVIGAQAEPKVLAAFNRRLSRDLAYQLKGYQRLMDAQQSILLRIMKAVWNVETYADLIRQTIDILATHDEIAVCAIGRPDEQGAFRFEAVAGLKAGNAALDMLLNPAQRPVTFADHPDGRGPVSLAWRSGRIERIINFRTYAQRMPRHEQSLGAGLRSCVAVPLHAPDQPASAVLLLFSAFPGGFVGQHQEAFTELLQTILGSAISRIRDLDNGGRTLSLAARKHFAALLRSDALQIHYQPLLDLHTGRVDRVEALARLRVGNQILAPAAFFPALSSDDFLVLFERGLDQAMLDRNDWLEQGVDLGVSINLPPAALNDVRYFEATTRALKIHGCPADRLMLEILENESLGQHEGQRISLLKFKALGVLLAQDDLGAGHSGLARLRNLPFDCIKIDRSIVNTSGEDAWDALRFAYQLTRLGHSLGKSVVVEGIETFEMLKAMMILGVDSIQGYALAKPMPARQVLSWFSGQPTMADVHACDGVLPRLAEFLIWEERLLLNLKSPQVASKRTGVAGRASVDVEVARRAPSVARCEKCPLVRSIDDFGDAPPEFCPCNDAEKTMTDIALTAGVDSKAFKRAHSGLMKTILEGR